MQHDSHPHIWAAPKAPFLQPKLRIGEPNDKYEQEADRVAEEVMRMPESRIVKGAGITGSASPTGIQRGCQECEEEARIRPRAIQRMCSSCEQELHRRPIEEIEEEETIQAKEVSGRTPEVTRDVEAGIDGLRGGGRPLPESVRTFFEPRFGMDFTGVRVHTDLGAASAASQVNARAFTLGRDVVFGAGEYAPATAAGRQMLAHELTHVVQQQGISSLPLQRLTEAEKAEDLDSPKYAGNPRLEKAFDNDPPLGIGESGEAVRLVQEGLVADGFDMPRSTKPTGEMDAGFGEETFTVIKRFQAKHGLGVDGVVGRETMGKLDELELKFRLPPSKSFSPSVDKIDIIDSDEGAVSAFGEVLGKSDLNKPGPFNDNDSGEVTNVHQIHFHLDRGNSSDLVPFRHIDAIFSHAGLKVPMQGPDGPPPREISRPNDQSIAVADPPGLRFSDESSYPFRMDAHFYLMVATEKGIRVAQVEYDVKITKKTIDEVPNTENRVIPGKKRDLVKDRVL